MKRIPLIFVAGILFLPFSFAANAQDNIDWEAEYNRLDRLAREKACLGPGQPDE